MQADPAACLVDRDLVVVADDHQLGVSDEREEDEGPGQNQRLCLRMGVPLSDDVNAGYGRTTLLASTPIFSTSASIRSPALRKFPVAAPTPSGVPVAMMSPGSSVMARESTSMH